jgi:hypothetical protein
VLAALYNEFKISIKSQDTEEKIDLAFYRPLGFLIAKFANLIGLSPTTLSISGLFFGLTSSYFFYNSSLKLSFLFGCLFLILSGLFDSADGQLARIAKKSSNIGIVLDGVCDSLVTILVYFACVVPFYQIYGISILPLVCAALYCHSYQCAILDFYHREYLCFGYGEISNSAFENPSVIEGQMNILQSRNRKEKIYNVLRLGWIKKQRFLTTRTEEDRSRILNYLKKCNSLEKEIFFQEYKKSNIKILTFWRLIGVNSHTAFFLFFVYFGKFDLYLIILDLIVFNVLILVIGQFQKKTDNILFEKFKLKFNEII